jgi:uncharacterized protein with WD repeat
VDNDALTKNGCFLPFIGNEDARKSSLFPNSRREKKGEWLMTDESVTRELAAAQKRVMRAWTKLEKKRENLINSLREIEHEMTAINPVVKALLRPSKELEAA